MSLSAEEDDPPPKKRKGNAERTRQSRHGREAAAVEAVRDATFLHINPDRGDDFTVDSTAAEHAAEHAAYESSFLRDLASRDSARGDLLFEIVRDAASCLKGPMHEVALELLALMSPAPVIPAPVAQETNGIRTEFLRLVGPSAFYSYITIKKASKGAAGANLVFAKASSLQCIACFRSKHHGDSLVEALKRFLADDVSRHCSVLLHPTVHIGPAAPCGRHPSGASHAETLYSFVGTQLLPRGVCCFPPSTMSAFLEMKPISKTHFVGVRLPSLLQCPCQNECWAEFAARVWNANPGFRDAVAGTRLLGAGVKELVAKPAYGRCDTDAIVLLRSSRSRWEASTLAGDAAPTPAVGTFSFEPFLQTFYDTEWRVFFSFTNCRGNTDILHIDRCSRAACNADYEVASAAATQTLSAGYNSLTEIQQIPKSVWNQFYQHKSGKQLAVAIQSALKRIHRCLSSHVAFRDMVHLVFRADLFYLPSSHGVGDIYLNNLHLAPQFLRSGVLQGVLATKVTDQHAKLIQHHFKVGVPWPM